MQAQLSELKPHLEQTAEETKRLMDEIFKDQEEVDKAKVTITMEEAEVAVQTKEIQKIKDEAEKDLVDALPALERAVRALNTLNRNDISEIKTFSNPPAGVLLVMEAICVVYGLPPNWATARSLLGEVDFLSNLIAFDKDNIPPKTILQLKKCIFKLIVTAHSTRYCKSSI
jgi:dynein heavy chain